MAVEYKYFSGKCKWMKSQTPNKFGDYSHDLYLDDKSMNLFMSLKEKKGETEGLLNDLKESKDGDGVYITLKRPQSKTIRGKVVGFAPPEILDKNNLPMHDILIGNGSDITTKVEYYTYKKPMGSGRGSAIRWASTRVDNLIPFVTQRDFDEDQQGLVRGLNEQPAQPAF